MDRWTLFRVPAHPRFLPQAVRAVVPIIRHAVEGIRLPGGIVGLPALLPALCREAAQYREPVSPRWRPWATPPRRLLRIRPVRSHPPARKVGGVGRPHASLGPGLPEASPGLPALPIADHHLPADMQLIARPILGGLHHEYGLEKLAA